jgi:hypothetical protein
MKSMPSVSIHIYVSRTAEVCQLYITKCEQFSLPRTINEILCINFDALTSQNRVITLGITTFNVKNFYVLPTSALVVSGFQNKPTNTSLTERFLINETECVYCAVQTEYLDIIQVSFRL